MSVGILRTSRLAKEFTDHWKGAIIVDARPRDQFLRGHIPGAVWIGWEAWCGPAPRHAGPMLAQGGYWGVMARGKAQEYSRRLASQGLSADQPIVVYADGPRTLGREGRIAWMLLYLGASNVYLLDGGWGSWLAERGEVQFGTKTPTIGHFKVRIQPARRRTLDELRAWCRTENPPVLVDTLSRLEFDGEIPQYLPRRGHLPGARLVSFASLFEPDGRYVARERYLDILPHEAQKAADLVAYCEVGVRASLFAVLHEAHTGQVVPVYDGSVMEWALEPGLPLVNDLSEQDSSIG